MKFYTWKDIERNFMIHRDQWEKELASLEIYPTNITIYRKSDDKNFIPTLFSELFKGNYDDKHNAIKLDIGDLHIPIYEYESDEEEYQMPSLPLFKRVLYQSSSYPSKQPPIISKPIIAFHSYKGGVGRTLSLLAFTKAWSSQFKDKKLLIVDADIEAPGLTWLYDNLSEDTFSYLDLLTLIQDNTDIDKIVDLACSKIKATTIMVETSEYQVEHIFIPTYRYTEQLLDIYATPESILSGKNKEYILSTVLSKICEKLGLDAAVVDLRAGISEYSAPLLFDPRVKKYLVTSTSTQSIKGTQMLLKYLLNGLEIEEDTVLPEVLINMVPNNLSNNEKEKVNEDIIQYYEQNLKNDDQSSLIDNVIVELPFASELIHLTTLDQIFKALQDRELFKKIEELISQNYCEKSKVKNSYTDSKRREILTKIQNLADAQLTAESNQNFDVLMTEPLKNLQRKYHDSIPTTVIMGSKGAGKTFLFRKMVESKDWGSFCNSLQQIEDNPDAPKGYFVPVICSKNNTELTGSLQECIKSVNLSVPCLQINGGVYLDNSRSLKKSISLQNDWIDFWQKLLVSSLNSQWKSFKEADEKLELCGQKVIFLIDGLEDILTRVFSDQLEQKAVQVLCQEIVSDLNTRYHNLGIVIFLRRDIAQYSIQVNFQQFEQIYKQVELKWSSNEALRLAVWLVSKADKTFYKGQTPVSSASQEVIENHLVKLWGLKLGKASSNEAYSSRWILAALSDFNGQLQARDIIRFLKVASSTSTGKITYTDRILMPAVIRSAVGTCSEEKMLEVKQEYPALKPIFERLENLNTNLKILPLNLNDIQLSSDEEKNMIREGYLKRDGDKYYLPEIIRHSLGFKYAKGARPKVLSLTLNK